MSWRYQPVWGQDNDKQGNAVARWYSLCEVYFDKDGHLESWTEDPAMRAVGDDLTELRRSLAQMLADAWKWKPVKFDDMKVGMSFERAITQEQSEEVADLVDAMCDRMGAAEVDLN